MGLRIAIDLDEVLVPMLSHLNIHFESNTTENPRSQYTRRKRYTFSKYTIFLKGRLSGCVELYNSEIHRKIRQTMTPNGRWNCFERWGIELYVLTARQLREESHRRSDTQKLWRHFFRSHIY